MVEVLMALMVVGVLVVVDTTETEVGMVATEVMAVAMAVVLEVEIVVNLSKEPHYDHQDGIWQGSVNLRRISILQVQ